MSKEKYYTPDATEFHIGFEYEFNSILEDRHSKNSKWVKDFYDFYKRYELDEPLDFILQGIESKNIRVKYLDEEDIIDLGWRISHKLINYIFEFGEYEFVIDWETQKIRISNAGMTVFAGFVNNKSELKKLMKQLEII